MTPDSKGFDATPIKECAENSTADELHPDIAETIPRHRGSGSCY
jgi:hypothetical protein